ncbi:titin homolog [Chelonus insularis]|uniref:titin homolog n=1 Tax=Chelonus insularis TaxID=460826 RepID=UPI00158B4D74|nr:titin homolog [Chelonus insularis]
MGSEVPESYRSSETYRSPGPRRSTESQSSSRRSSGFKQRLSQLLCLSGEPEDLNPVDIEEGVEFNEYNQHDRGNEQNAYLGSEESKLSSADVLENNRLSKLSPRKTNESIFDDEDEDEEEDDEAVEDEEGYEQDVRLSSKLSEREQILSQIGSVRSSLRHSREHEKDQRSRVISDLRSILQNDIDNDSRKQSKVSKISDPRSITSRSSKKSEEPVFWGVDVDEDYSDGRKSKLSYNEAKMMTIDEIERAIQRSRKSRVSDNRLKPSFISDKDPRSSKLSEREYKKLNEVGSIKSSVRPSKISSQEQRSNTSSDLKKSFDKNSLSIDSRKQSKVPSDKFDDVNLSQRRRSSREPQIDPKTNVVVDKTSIITRQSKISERDGESNIIDEESVIRRLSKKPADSLKLSLDNDKLYLISEDDGRRYSDERKSRESSKEARLSRKSAETGSKRSSKKSGSGVKISLIDDRFDYKPETRVSVDEKRYDEGRRSEESIKEGRLSRITKESVSRKSSRRSEKSRDGLKSSIVDESFDYTSRSSFPSDEERRSDIQKSQESLREPKISRIHESITSKRSSKRSQGDRKSLFVDNFDSKRVSKLSDSEHKWISDDSDSEHMRQSVEFVKRPSSIFSRSRNASKQQSIDLEKGVRTTLLDDLDAKRYSGRADSRVSRMDRPRSVFEDTDIMDQTTHRVSDLERQLILDPRSLKSPTRSLKSEARPTDIMDQTTLRVSDLSRKLKSHAQSSQAGREDIVQRPSSSTRASCHYSPKHSFKSEVAKEYYAAPIDKVSDRKSKSWKHEIPSCSMKCSNPSRLQDGKVQKKCQRQRRVFCFLAEDFVQGFF